MSLKEKLPDSLSDLRILVTGATGFVGSVLMPELIRKFGAQSLSAYVLPGDKIPESWEREKVSVFCGDITDSEALGRACQEQNHVIHLAGYISYWRRDFERLMRVNRDGVKHLIDACLKHRIQRLIHVSSVGALGYQKKGQTLDEDTAFNWPPYFHYMTSKYQGQRLVEEAVSQKKLPAIILNPASIMGPGDSNLETPHSQLYSRIYQSRLLGSFAGGLGIVDVRDVVAIIMKALELGQLGEKYLLVGANLSYQDLLRKIGQEAQRRVLAFRIPSFFLAALGLIMEMGSTLTRRRPLMTYSYGRLSGWHVYYTNKKSRRAFFHTYIDWKKTIGDSCRYFEATFL